MTANSACKALYTGSIPVSASPYLMTSGNTPSGLLQDSWRS